MSKEQFMEALEDVATKMAEETPRQLRVLTGLEGMFEFDRQIKREVTRGSLEYLHSQNLIPIEEYESLKMMVNASDADFTVAELIISQRANEFNI